MFLEPFERTKVLSFESQLKKLNFKFSFFLQVKFKTRLKSCIFGLNFVSDLAQVGEVRYIASCIILVANNNPVEDLP